MIYSARLKKFLGCLSALSILLAFSQTVGAVELSLYWSGKIRNVQPYPGGTVPAGISAQSVIKGHLVFETGAYVSSQNITESDYSGEVYEYPIEMVHTVIVENHKWIINGADVWLTDPDPLNNPSRGRVFSVTSNSGKYSYDLFPGYIGSFNFNVTLYDQNDPYLLYDSNYDILNLQLRPSGITTALGELGTILRDHNLTPLGGYHFDFEIDHVSYASHSKLDAHFKVDQVFGVTSHPINFTDQSDGSPTSWLWDFGDGQTSSEENPSHIYSSSGIYFVNLIVTDENGFAKEYGAVNIAPSEVDINDDYKIDLTDMIMVLQILAGVELHPSKLPDINGDFKTGLEEVGYISRYISTVIR